MKVLSYTFAALLFIDWAISYLVYGMNRGVHVLLVIAFATVIQQVIQSPKISYQLLQSSRLRKRAWKISQRAN